MRNLFKKIKNKKILLIIALTLFTSLFFFENYYNFGKSGSPGLKFTAKRCFDPGPAIDKINQIAQEGNDTVVYVTISPICEISQVIGKYNIKGSNISIYYTTRGRSAAACLCPIEAVYRLKNINKNDYNIKFEFPPL